MVTATNDPASTKYTLLVVDDEEGPRQSLRMVFRNDFNVVTKETGAEALEFARENPVHVAILDIRMAGCTGIDVLRGLKEINPLIEVIMLTAYETLDTARQALRLGACDYLSKPFDLSTVRNAVNRAVQLHNVSHAAHSAGSRISDLTNRLEDIALREEMAKTTNEIYAGVLHDINNPLTIIKLYIELLAQRLSGTRALQGQDLETVRGDIQMIDKQINTCTAITTRYLRFINRQNNHTRKLGINHILGDIQTLLKGHPSARNVELEVSMLSKEIVPQIEATDLSQAIINLTVNAFQSTTSRQVVSIKAAIVQQAVEPPENLGDVNGEIFVGWENFLNNPPFLAVTIADQGSGIPLENLSRVFEPYFTTKKERGTGLGLSIVARLVKTHSGMIHLCSQPDLGTRVTLYFPVNSQEKAGS